MPLPKVLKRELEVSFAKHAQPVWLRISKYIALAAMVYLLWGTEWLWISLLIVFSLGLSVHFWFRYKRRHGHKVMAPGNMRTINRV